MGRKWTVITTSVWAMCKMLILYCICSTCPLQANTGIRFSWEKCWFIKGLCWRLEFSEVWMSFEDINSKRYRGIGNIFALCCDYHLTAKFMFDWHLYFEFWQPFTLRWWTVDHLAGSPSQHTDTRQQMGTIELSFTEGGLVVLALVFTLLYGPTGIHSFIHLQDSHLGWGQRSGLLKSSSIEVLSDIQPVVTFTIEARPAMSVVSKNVFRRGRLVTSSTLPL